MRIGLSTLLFPTGSLSDCLELAHKLEVDCLEIVLDMPHFPLGSEREKLEKLRNSVSSFDQSRVHARFWDLNPISQYEEIRQITLRRIKESVDACDRVGGDVVTVHPGFCWFRNNNEIFGECKKRYRDFLEDILSYARGRGIHIGLENGSHSAGYPREVEEFIELTEMREELGITFDVGHAFLSAQNQGQGVDQVVEMIDSLGDEIVNVHLHDNNGREDEHLPPGEGMIEFEPIFNALGSCYDGYIVLELWNVSEPARAAEEGVESLKGLLS